MRKQTKSSDIFTITYNYELALVVYVNNSVRQLIASGKCFIFYPLCSFSNLIKTS